MSFFNRKKHVDPESFEASPAPRAPNRYEKEITWEAARIEMVERSERRAWGVAKLFGLLLALATIAIAFMMPLKEAIPFLVRVDNTTGVPDIITRMDAKDVKFDEVMDKYWLARFVTARESYDWNIIQKDYDTVGLLSSPLMAEQYAKLFEGSQSLEAKYGNRVKVTVKVISVVPDGRGIGTVRFIKETKSVQDTSSYPGTVTKWVATVGYEYKNSSLLRESSRLVNPMGFQVNSYRVDPEAGGMQ